MATVIEAPLSGEPEEQPKASETLKPNFCVPSEQASDVVKPETALSAMIADLYELQRERRTTQKSRIMIGNRLVATVATAKGYHASMEEKERGKRFDEASKLIRRVQSGKDIEDDKDRVCLSHMIQSCSVAVDGFYLTEKAYEKEMEKIAKQLPVAKWMALTDQRGFGWLSLGIIIGETGDLSNYANPGKLWKRMGCAPIISKGQTRMPSSWKSRKKENGGLTSAEWEKNGYCPRRRSVMYVISESLLKGNGARAATEKTKALPAGPYRLRYDDKKAEVIARGDPKWTPVCKKCDGTGQAKSGGDCSYCSGRGKMVMRPHMHGMLLASKRLLRELWTEWVWAVDGYEPEPWSG